MIEFLDLKPDSRVHWESATYTPDSRRYVYISTRGKKKKKKKRGIPHDEITGLTFLPALLESPDGKVAALLPIKYSQSLKGKTVTRISIHSRKLV